MNIKNSMLFRDSVREIKHSFARFLSIILIMTVGVGFFVGIKATSPSMKKTAEDYYREKNLFDLEILSSAGFGEDDREALLDITGVKSVYLGYQLDCMCYEGGVSSAFRFYSTQDEGENEINSFTLTEGRMPKSSGECVVCATDVSGYEYKVGGTLEIESVAGGEAVEDYLKTKKYKIVGIGTGAMFFSYDYGTTTVGAGQVEAYGLIYAEDFDFPRYTVAFIDLDDDTDVSAFSEEYDNLVNNASYLIATVGKVQYENYIEEVKKELDEAQKQLADGEEESQDEITKAYKQLAEAKEQLDEAKAQLDEGWASYYENLKVVEDGWEQYNSEFGDADTQLAEAWQQLQDARKQLDDGWREYNSQYASFVELASEYYDGENTLADAKAQIDEAQAQYEDGLAQLEAGREQYNEGLRQYEEGLSEYNEGYAEYAEGKQQLDDAKAQLDAAKQQLDDAKEQIDQGWADLEQGELDYESGKVEYEEGLVEYQSGLQQLAAAKAQLDAGQKEYDEGLAQFEEGSEMMELVEKGNNLSYLMSNGVASSADVDNFISILTQLASYSGNSSVTSQLSLLRISYNLTGDTSGFVSAWSTVQSSSELQSAYTQVSEAKAQLDAAKAELDAGWKEYNEGVAELDAAKAQLDAAKVQIDSFPSQKATYEQQLNEAEVEYSEGLQEYYAGLKEYEEGLAEFNAANPELEEAKAQLDEAYNQLLIAKKEIDDNEALLEDAKRQLDEVQEQYLEGLNQLTESSPEIQQAEAQFAAAKKELEDGEAEYAAGLAEYNEGKQYAGSMGEDAKAQLEEGEKQLAEAKAQLDAGQKEYDEGLAAYEAGLEEYYEGVMEAEDKLIDARAQIQTAMITVNEIEEGKWYIFTRDDIVTNYSALESDADNIGTIASVFPIFFLAVAALVCLTTISRMVDEDRLQLGTYKALGYSKKQILFKYVFYAASAAVIGTLIGVVVGILVIPKSIITAYSMMYNFGIFRISVNGWAIVIALMAAVLCTVSVAVFCVNRELKGTTASLMRPKAPKAGSHIALEKVSFLWNHLSFSVKNSLRNITRHKLRMCMTIVGVFGCTSLMIAGFALGDSMETISDRQYGELTNYDYQAIYLSPYAEDEVSEAKAELTADERVEDMTFIYSNTITVLNDEDEVAFSGVYLTVPCDEENYSEYENLRDLDGNPLGFDENTVIINMKMADEGGYKVGDTIKLRLEDEIYTATITAINEQYIFNTVYMSKDSFRTIIGEEPTYGTAYVKKSDVEFDETRFLYEVLEDYDNVVAFIPLYIITESIDDAISNMNVIVLVIIICAGALAFVVLYNLTNINIAERIREIATVAVLGFTKREKNAYVFRENIYMSIVAIILGWFGGTALSKFIISTLSIDQIVLISDIDITSYIYSTVLTIGFIIIVNLVMTRVINKIDMVESMKAVE